MSEWKRETHIHQISIKRLTKEMDETFSQRAPIASIIESITVRGSLKRFVETRRIRLTWSFKDFWPLPLLPYPPPHPFSDPRILRDSWRISIRNIASRLQMNLADSSVID